MFRIYDSAARDLSCFSSALLLLTLLRIFDFGWVEIGIVFLLLALFAFFLSLFFLVVVIIFKGFASEEEHSPGNDSFPNVVTNFKVGGEKFLSLSINFSLGVLR